ncbi:MAG: hypothetical protein E6Q34_11205 [Burkholderiaceae bacterium]|nr:MAG: hypothetical protein E6Q34_11205 [Burkholderiaceae bacterium]
MTSTTQTLDHPLPAWASALPDWRRPMNFVLYNIVGWTLLCAFVAFAVYTDDLRADRHPQFGTIFFNWVAAALALAPLSWILYYAFLRWEDYLGRLSFIVLAYLSSFLFIAPWHVFDAWFSMIWAKDGVEFLDVMWSWHNAVCLFRLSAISVVFGAVLGVRLWQQNRDRLLALRDQRERRLQLRLALERRNLAVLRAQLEPHFMFNSLNAVSGLVRTAQNENALTAIEKLSELLRYSLASSEKQEVSMREELSGLEDYLSLQSLRYGDRLQVQIDGLNDEVYSCDCPPFFLQPLIENAIKHDLDRHKGISDIRIEFRIEASNVHCIVSNPLHATTSVGTGFGLGLKTLKARLDALYGEAANLNTTMLDGRFLVKVSLPYAD